MTDRDRGFAEYFATRSEVMRRTAYLLCGDWHRAEDLVQTAFVRLYRAWRRLDDRSRLDAYARQVLVRAFLDETRRGFFRREKVTGEPVDGWAGVVGGPAPEDRVVLLAALAKVPSRQRTTLVLRFWEDLSLEETARAMGCSAGTVKSQTARGLAALRELLPTHISS